MTSFIQTNGAALASQGYLICPIKPGEKRPIGKAWGDNPLSPEQCRSYPREAGVGIICGKGDRPIYGIDVDIPGDAEFAEDFRVNVIEKMFDGTVSYRVGKAPKFLVPVRGPAGMLKSVSRWFVKNGVDGRLEILGCGQQFVAEHIYPGTDRPYQWFGGSFLFDGLPPPGFLPEINADATTRLVEEFEKMAEAHGWEARDGQDSFSPVVGDDVLGARLSQTRMGVTVEEIEPYVMDVELPEGHGARDVWVRVGMALHFEFAGTQNEQAAIDLWARWSEADPRYKGFNALLSKWDSFGRYSGACVTLAWVKACSKYSDRISQLNDLGMAYRLYKQYAGRLLFAQDRGTWYGWDGYHWCALSDGEAQEYVFNMCDSYLRDEIKQCQNEERKSSLMKLYQKASSAQSAKNVLSAAESVPGFRALSSDFDSDTRWFGCENGDIDLETGALVPPDPMHKVSKSCGIKYDPDAKCPLWIQTIADTQDADIAADVVDYIQRIAGYAMFGKPTAETMFMWQGNGCNGKSTIVNTLRDVFGDYGGVVNAETLTASSKTATASGGAPRSDIISLQGVRFASASETDQGVKMREATVKSLVSTDAIKARAPFDKADRIIRPSWVITMATNYPPNIDGDDEGIWRRIQMLSFTKDFNKDPRIKKDLHRADNLRKEYPGILNWIVEGAMKYRQSGFKQPKASTKETEQYRGDMDVLGDWLSERCEVDGDAKVSCSDAFQSWRAWAEHNGYGHLLKTPKAFGMRVKRKGFKSTVFKRLKAYLGFRLKDALV